MLIVYCSMTGNVRAFVKKLNKLNESIATLELKNGKEVVSEKYLLITHTTGKGEIPPKLVEFLKNINNTEKCLGVVGSGNKNWGLNYCKGAYLASIIVAKPVYHTFELKGNEGDVKKVGTIITDLQRE